MIKSKVKELMLRRKDLKAEHERLQKQCEEMRKRCEVLPQRRRSLEQEKAEHINAIDKLKKDVSALEARKASCEKSVAECKADYQRFAERAKDLEGAAKDVATAVSYLPFKLEQMTVDDIDSSDE